MSEDRKIVLLLAPFPLLELVAPRELDFMNEPEKDAFKVRRSNGLYCVFCEKLRRWKAVDLTVPSRLNRFVVKTVETLSVPPDKVMLWFWYLPVRITSLNQFVFVVMDEGLSYFGASPELLLARLVNSAYSTEFSISGFSGVASSPNSLFTLSFNLPDFACLVVTMTTPLAPREP